MGTKIAGHAEALGEKAVDRVAYAGNKKDQKRDLHLVRPDRPNDDRHQQNAADGDQVGKVQDGEPKSTGATTLISINQPDGIAKGRCGKETKGGAAICRRLLT